MNKYLYFFKFIYLLKSGLNKLDGKCLVLTRLFILLRPVVASLHSNSVPAVATNALRLAALLGKLGMLH